MKNKVYRLRITVKIYLKKGTTEEATSFTRYYYGIPEEKEEKEITYAEAFHHPRIYLDRNMLNKELLCIDNKRILKEDIDRIEVTKISEEANLSSTYPSTKELMDKLSFEEFTELMYDRNLELSLIKQVLQH